jgi:hypothetical protein
MAKFPHELFRDDGRDNRAPLIRRARGGLVPLGSEIAYLGRVTCDRAARGRRSAGLPLAPQPQLEWRRVVNPWMDPRVKNKTQQDGGTP